MLSRLTRDPIISRTTLSEAASVVKSGLNVFGEAGTAIMKRPPRWPGVDLLMSGFAGKGCPEREGLRLQPALASIRPTAAIRKQSEKLVILPCDTGLNASQQAPSAFNCRTGRRLAATRATFQA